MSNDNLNPFLLAASTPQPDARLIPLLRSDRSLAAQQDDHGYSLLHAAASYNHVSLLRTLVEEFNVEINLQDEDGETCLFVTETVEVATCLLQELGINAGIKNTDGLTASEKIIEEGDFPEVAAYIDRVAETGSDGLSTTSGQPQESVHPPRLPPNMNLNFREMTEEQLGTTSAQQPDPDFRRRIEELASKEGFETPEGQQELRDLVTDAVRGVNQDERDVRRRTG